MENETAQDAGTEAVADNQTVAKLIGRCPGQLPTTAKPQLPRASEITWFSLEASDSRFNCCGNYGDNFNSTVCTVLSL